MTPGRRRDMGDSFAIFQEEWVSGTPKKKGITGWFTGKGDSKTVITYACPQCGILESYLKDIHEKS